MGCNFCNFSENKQMIYEDSDERFFAFYKRDPITRGHVIVAPKKHVLSIADADLEEDDTKELMLFIKKIYCAIEKVMDTKKIYICSFNESEDTHLHFHLIPVPVDREDLPFTEKYGDWGNKGPVLYFMLSTFKDWEMLDEIVKSSNKDKKLGEIVDRYYDKKLGEGEDIIKKLRSELLSVKD